MVNLSLVGVVFRGDAMVRGRIVTDLVKNLFALPHKKNEGKNLFAPL